MQMVIFHTAQEYTAQKMKFCIKENFIENFIFCVVIHIKEVISNLKNVCQISKWFYDNCNGNSVIYHLLINKNFEPPEMKVDDKMISVVKIDLSSYCAFIWIWMFHSRKLIDRINPYHVTGSFL